MASIGGAGWLQAAGGFVETWGMLENSKSARIQAERTRVANEFAIFEAKRQAGIAISVSQRQADEERRQANLLASRALAVSAASGAGVSDPTIVNLIARAKGEGVYRANVALYEGEARSRELRVQGVLGNVDTGMAREAGYKLAAAGSAFKTGASLYSKYGMNGPGASGDSALIDAGSASIPDIA